MFTHVEPGPFGNFLAMMLCGAQACHEQYSFDVSVLERQLIHGAMNTAASTVVQHGHEGLIVFDDDCYPPFDAIPRLLSHAEAGHPIVAGVGLMRNYPHTTTVGRYFPEGYSLVRRKDGHMEWRGFGWLDDLTGLPKGLMTVDFCGMPVMWISREVLEAIEPPWFGTHLDGGDMTHDVYFAKKAQAAGFTLQVDTTLQCGHLTGAKVVTFENRAEVRGVAIMLDAMKRGEVEHLHRMAEEWTDEGRAAEGAAG